MSFSTAKAAASSDQTVNRRRGWDGGEAEEGVGDVSKGSGRGSKEGVAPLFKEDLFFSQ